MTRHARCRRENAASATNTHRDEDEDENEDEDDDAGSNNDYGPATHRAECLKESSALMSAPKFASTFIFDRSS